MRPRALDSGLRRSLLGLLLLLAAGCFDEPIEERLLFSFLADGSVQVHLTVLLGESERSSEAAERRARELAEDLLRGDDRWSPRFAAVDAASESLFWRREEGRLARYERRLVLEDPGQLAAFLADTGIVVSFDGDETRREVSLYPSLPARATRRERRAVAEALEEWSQALAIYLSAVSELYRELEGRPWRAHTVFSHLFEGPEAEATTETEEELLEAVVEGVDAVMAVFWTDDDSGESLEELSRKVFDPFPASPLEIELFGAALEAEGFVAVGDRWRIPGLSFWSAFSALEGRWLSPDPLVAQLAHDRSGSDLPFDVGGFAARARSWSPPPDAEEVRLALEEGLSPAAVYRLAWEAPPPGTERPE